ncbi:MAG: hypothetical protein HYU59_12575 [Magnetospirillum gryphiswaldense]|nr:hypothetical protein [Magnetospirillum gryphiswaldense]
MKRRMLLMILAAAPLAACGRKSRPLPPEGATYPRQYPNVTFPDSPESAEKQPETQQK